MRQVNKIDQDRFAIFLQDGPDRKCWHPACQSYRAIVVLARRRGEPVPMLWEVQARAKASRHLRRPMPLPMNESPTDNAELTHQLFDVSEKLDNLTNMIGRGYDARRRAAEQRQRKEEENKPTGEGQMFRTSTNG